MEGRGGGNKLIPEYPEFKSQQNPSSHTREINPFQKWEKFYERFLCEKNYMGFLFKMNAYQISDLLSEVPL